MIAEHLQKRHPLLDLPIPAIRKMELQPARAMLNDYLQQVIPTAELRQRFNDNDFREHDLAVEELIVRILDLEASEPDSEPDEQDEPEPQIEPETSPEAKPAPPEAIPEPPAMSEDEAEQYLENRFGGGPEDWTHHWRSKTFQDEPLTRLALDSYFGGTYKAPAVVEAERSEAERQAREELLSQFPPDVAQAICEAKPARGTDKPDNWVYALCRYLKGTSLWKQPKSDHRPAVAAWWGLLEHRIRTGNLTHLEDCWMLYCKASERTKSAGSKGILAMGMERAKERIERNDFGEVALRYTNPAVQRLVVLCEELQEVNCEFSDSDSPVPFFLGCRQAEEFTGVSRSRVRDYLAVLLPMDGVLKLGRRGDKFEKGKKRTFDEKASEYYTIHVLKQRFGDDVAL